MRTFFNSYINKPPVEYFRALHKKVTRNINYHRIPDKYKSVFDQQFVKDCRKNLKNNSIESKINAVLKSLNVSNFEFIGDKGADSDVLVRMEEAGMDYRLVYIYRDGRDVAHSGARHHRGKKPPWSNSKRENGIHWAKRVKTFLNNKHLLDPDKYVMIRFEDYVDNPGRNMSKVQKLLGLNGLVEVEKRRISPKQAHKGYYAKNYPEWKTDFPPIGIEVLKELGYI